MKVTKNYIKQLIKEELRKVLNEDPGNYINLDPVPRLRSRNAGDGGLDEKLLGYAKSKRKNFQTTQTIDQIIEVVRDFMEFKGISKEEIGRAVEDYAMQFDRNRDMTASLNFYKREIQSKL